MFALWHLATRTSRGNRWSGLGAAMSVTPGWDAIDKHLQKIYPGPEPKHWGTIMRYSDGGPDPLDGISAYRVDDPPHWHWVGFGLTELGPKQSKDKAVSGWGFEV